jgi:hypothetical protein
MSPFDFINAISLSKKDMMTDTDNDELAEKSYSPYLVNKGLSYFPDTILYANEMNLYSQLDHKPQFAYLLNSIRPRKRFSKWFKNELDEETKIISEYYQYSTQKARQVRHLITSEQLNLMREKLQKGGLKPKEKK